MLHPNQKPKTGEVTGLRLEFVTVTLLSGQGLKCILNIYTCGLDLFSPPSKKLFIQLVEVSAKRQNGSKCLEEENVFSDLKETSISTSSAPYHQED